jgi:hypothetical protein
MNERDVKVAEVKNIGRIEAVEDCKFGWKSHWIAHAITRTKVFMVRHVLVDNPDRDSSFA